MRRKPSPDDLAIWAKVAGTVKALPGRTIRLHEPTTTAPGEVLPASPGKQPPRAKGPGPRARPAKLPSPKPPERLEPKRALRVIRERVPIDARIDLHGLTIDAARSALERFVLGAWDRGDRHVLVITGKGSLGEGMIRRLTPEWLAAAPIRPAVAGVQHADRRHGGEGALYVALKRKP